MGDGPRRARGGIVRRGGRAELRVESPRLWWPRGYGGQPLYELRARLNGSDDDGAWLSRRVGLRTVRLVQDAAAAPAAGHPAGTTFFFEVNGVEVYAKGSNLIPLSVFEDRVTDEDIEWTLSQAVDGNMNMVRVWGGGRYQRDSFYDAADRLGLLLWQEMAFACALYPRDAAFLSLVSREVDEQVRRLATHPSIVIWGGNNENEGAMHWYTPSQTVAGRDIYLADYVKLYVDTIRPAVLGADADGRPFVDSSPSNAVLSYEPYVKRWGDVQAWSWGDVHYYNYDADCEDRTTYPQGRFVSEHGFQSFPSFRLYRNVTAPADWSRESSQLFYRQRHEHGNEQVLAMIGRHYAVPPANASDAATQQQIFDDYLWLTQLQQARCYETAFGEWRRLRAAPAHTMGILYWQLNDVWPGPSWSTLEADGSQRVAHHAVRRAFAPLLLSATDEGDTFGVHLTNDGAAASGTLTVELFRWADAAPAAPAAAVPAAKVSVGAHTSTLVSTAHLAPLLAAAATDRNHSVVRLTFAPDGDGAAPPVVAFHFLTPFKYAKLPSAAAANLRITKVEQTAPDSATVAVAADATAAFVTLESLAVVGAFSGGAFTLLAGGAATVTFRAREHFSVDALRRGLRVRSLADTLTHASVMAARRAARRRPPGGSRAGRGAAGGTK